MNESFSPAKQEVLSSKEALSPYSNLLARLNKSKEYISNLPENLKKAGMITVIFSLGVFSVAEGQNQDPNLKKTADDLFSKKINIEYAADSIYQKVEKDKTFSYVEYTQSQLGDDIKADVKVSGPEIMSMSTGDTISIGDFEAKEYSVMVTENLESSGDIIFKQENRLLSGIKPYSGQTEKKLKIKEISNKSFGKTKEQAIISAIAGLAGIEKTDVSVANQSKTEQSTVGNKESFSKDFIELSTFKTDSTILNNVRVVVSTTPDGFSAEAFCH